MSARNRQGRQSATCQPRSPNHSITQSLVITIDGPGGVGKSTVAKLLAQRLRMRYLDTGATYRALAYAALQRRLNPVTDVAALAMLAHRLPLRLQQWPGGALQVLLDGVDISRQIRTEQVSEAAAQLSQHPAVRQAMVALQRGLANQHSVVVEGRDTGSVVFPHATQKFFLDADPAIRARRRQRELAKRYKTRLSLIQVQEQLQFRDGLDRGRKVGPLVQPAGAKAIETSRLSARQVVRRMLQYINRPITAKPQKSAKTQKKASPDPFALLRPPAPLAIRRRAGDFVSLR